MREKKLNRSLMLAYLYSALSYVFREQSLDGKIKRLSLFGSVARNDFDDDSDVDLFIETDKKEELMVKNGVERGLVKFQNIEGEKWRLKGISNEIKIKVGRLEEWQLASSVKSEGIVLFSPEKGNNLQKYFWFSYDAITSAKKRMKVKRTLFGREEKGFKSLGLVQKYGGKITSTRSFTISAEGQREVAAFLSGEKVFFSFKEIWQ